MTDLLRFHAIVYARPAAIASGPRQSLLGREITPLAASQAELLSGWPITFDEAAQALQRLPQMFLEPDGSFVWVSSAGEPAWQVDGVLYDRGERLAYVELKGSCASARFDDLLRSLGWPQTRLVFELVAEGVLLAEAEFRRVATAES